MRAQPGGVTADLYVLLRDVSDATWRVIQPEWPQNKPYFAARQDDVLLERVELPATLAGWRFEQVSLSDAAFDKYCVPVGLKPENIANIPDTLDWYPLRLVSPRLRDLLEDAYPDGGVFRPAHFRDTRTGEVKPMGLWHWLPRRWLSFRAPQTRGRDQWLRPQVWGALGQQMTVWEVCNNRHFQNLVADFPYWAADGKFGEIVFRADLYRRIREAGFSGFNEAVRDNYLRQAPGDTIGYLTYRR